MGLCPEPKPHSIYLGGTSQSVEIVGEQILRILKRRKRVAGWVCDNLKAMEGCTSDETRLNLRAQNLCYSELYDAADFDLRVLITAYVNACNRDLSVKLASSLPRELRAMIFTFVTAESDAVALDHRASYHPRYARSGPLIESKFYLEPTFMGDLAREVKQAFFSRNTFHVFSSLDLKLILKSAELDWSYKQNITPRDLIRRMIVEVRGDIGGLRRSAEELCDALDYLRAIRRPRGFQLEIMISAKDPERLEDILNALQKVRARLISASIKVQVTSREYDELKYPKSLDPYFDSTTNWEAYLQAYRAGLDENHKEDLE